PVANLKLLVLDNYLNGCPVNIAGELCVGGDGISRGYLNAPGLTAAKFIKSPYSDAYPLSPPLIYRTGDMARNLPNGDILFLGRIDDQVKIRGFRIEPGEIAEQLLLHEAVSDAVVLPVGPSEGEKSLCAYIVTVPGDSDSGKEFTDRQFKEFLSGRLPAYMVPDYYIRLDRMPLNPNGKVDLKALPEPEMKSGREYVPPRIETEKLLVNIWADILDVKRDEIHIDDNFFDFGGHSLNAAQLASRIQRRFNVNLTLTDILINPTIRGISFRIKNAVKEEHLSIEPIEEKEYY
ncbi:MAG: AMP-binding protein, partial [bacterium]|nr:AMP-binding protein [bacterium]